MSDPEDPTPSVNEVLRFLGQRSAESGHLPVRNARPYGIVIDDAIEEWLYGYFTEPNRQLCELLGTDYGWRR
jgi:hypothetical protein